MSESYSNLSHLSNQTIPEETKNSFLGVYNNSLMISTHEVNVDSNIIKVE